MADDLRLSVDYRDKLTESLNNKQIALIRTEEISYFKESL